MPDKTITQDDYIKLRGLAVIAGEHTRALDIITKAAASITGEEDDGGNYFGCTSDEFVERQPDVDGLLAKLKIEVAPGA